MPGLSVAMSEFAEAASGCPHLLPTVARNVASAIGDTCLVAGE
jgi:hypothetical protein